MTANSTLPIAVIFDMDGVIIDSNPAIIKAWNNFFEGHRIFLTSEQLKHYVFGRTCKDTLELVFGQTLENTRLAAYEKTVIKEVAQLYAKESKPVPGVTEFIKSLADQGIPVAIATSAPGENVGLVLHLTGLSGYIPVISDASHATFPKPHPEIYLRTAQRLGIDPAHCVVFEDSFSGIAAAKAAGMTVIGLSTTHKAKELADQTVEVIADFTRIDAAHLREILNITR